MAWPCMASSGFRLLVFIDVTEDIHRHKFRSIWSNSAKCIRADQWCFTAQMDKLLKHTKETHFAMTGSVSLGSFQIALHVWHLNPTEKGGGHGVAFKMAHFRAYVAE